MKELFENLQGFIQTKIDLLKLEFQEKVEETTKKGLGLLTIGVFGFLSIIFFMLTLAFLISGWLKNYFWGFGIVTLILALISVIIYFSIIKKSK